MIFPKVIPNKFTCEFCVYNTSNKKDYHKHLFTLKHINTINTIKYNKLSPDDKEYRCDCGKKYKHNASLFNHKKKCSDKSHDKCILDASSNEIKILSNLVLEVIKNNNELQKQNQDLQQKMFELCKNNKPIINNNTNTNSNNKTFNLQFFLNEECKDAMNMSEFINSIQLKLSDLENMEKLGYIEGMSNIIIKQLNDTDMNKRPVHCSDAKRETLYIKEENKWEKEGPENKKMIGAVRGVDKKNYMMLNLWKDTYPKCMNSESNQCDAYMKLVGIVMSGDTENINKVIKKVSKEVVIDK